MCMTHEERMEMRRLRARLAAAEDVCLLVGWTEPARGLRGKALHELWRRWAAFPGVSTDPDDHPRLDDSSLAFLAAERDRIREATRNRLPATEAPS